MAPRHIRSMYHSGKSGVSLRDCVNPTFQLFRFGEPYIKNIQVGAHGKKGEHTKGVSASKSNYRLELKLSHFLPNSASNQ